MENVLLIIHLLLALALIGVVLLQRSEGGGLGIGGGGGGLVSARGAANFLTKVTWGLAAAFIATSITLTILAAKNSANSSVVDRLQDAPIAVESEEELPSSLGGGGSLLPPPSLDAPMAPPRAD
ncbi:MAG: preprotein translocase subunit SecG [Mangrovicoccus sp.]